MSRFSSTDIGNMASALIAADRMAVYVDIYEQGLFSSEDVLEPLVNARVSYGPKDKTLWTSPRDPYRSSGRYKTVSEYELLQALALADNLAKVCDQLIANGKLNARSMLADARLDFGTPHTYPWSEAAERLNHPHAPSFLPAV